MFLMQQTKGEPLHRFIQWFRKVSLKVHIRDESTIIHNFKLALAVNEKECFKTLLLLQKIQEQLG